MSFIFTQKGGLGTFFLKTVFLLCKAGAGESEWASLREGSVGFLPQCLSPASLGTSAVAAVSTAASLSPGDVTARWTARTAPTSKAVVSVLPPRAAPRWLLLVPPWSWAAVRVGALAELRIGCSGVCGGLHLLEAPPKLARTV